MAETHLKNHLHLKIRKKSPSEPTIQTSLLLLWVNFPSNRQQLGGFGKSSIDVQRDFQKHEAYHPAAAKKEHVDSRHESFLI